MEKFHHYKTTITWTGNRGSGTIGYDAYDRSHIITIENKTDIAGSSDPAFRGNHSLHNPEDLFLSSLSACHMLWYLHLCADKGIVVTAYKDIAKGTMQQTLNGGKFTEVILHPEVKIKELQDLEMAMVLHEEAHRHCYIANSCNFPVRHEPLISF